MTFEDLSKQLNTSVQSLQNLVQVLSAAFADMEGGGGGTSYSTEERVVGEFIDGKPLYQKTIDFGALPSNDVKDVSHGVSNVDKIWVSGGFAYQPSGDFSNQLSLCVPSSLSDGWYFGVTSSAVRCQTSADRSSYSAYVTIQYTKSTD